MALPAGTGTTVMKRSRSSPRGRDDSAGRPGTGAADAGGTSSAASSKGPSPAAPSRQCS
jgi:hypothetical protein